MYHELETFSTHPDIRKCTETIPNDVLFAFGLEPRRGIGTTMFVEIVTHLVLSTCSLTALKLT